MVFVGAGYIAVEMAMMVASLGVETHMFIRGSTFLRKFDPMVQQCLTEWYEKAGVHIHKEHPGVEKVELLNPAKDETDPREKRLKITSKDGSVLEANEIMWAIGRGAETRGLGIENTGIKLDKTGHVVVDKYQNTSVSGVYALGDITGQAELTPVAIAAGRTLGNRLFGPEEYKDAYLDYTFIPTVVFAHPTVGTTGYTEPEAVKEFGKANVKVYETKFAAMFYDFHEKDHKPPTQYKMIVTGPEERVVGLHLVGDGSDEAMQGFGVRFQIPSRLTGLRLSFDLC
jgi:glutathione reductase (NADPH)